MTSCAKISDYLSTFIRQSAGIPYSCSRPTWAAPEVVSISWLLNAPRSDILHADSVRPRKEPDQGLQPLLVWHHLVGAVVILGAIFTQDVCHTCRVHRRCGQGGATSNRHELALPIGHRKWPMFVVCLIDSVC